MRRFSFAAMLIVAPASLLFVPAVTHDIDPVSPQSACVDCHSQLHPSIVSDWRLSKHGQNRVDCSVCHGTGHTTVEDVTAVEIPTPETCAMCHAERVEQFKAGKHALAWTAMKAMPRTHALPMAMREDMKDCGGCHKIGIKTEEEIQAIRTTGSGFGVASCDACHTRHLFSVREARQPQACQTCHMGFDHPQWEMYSSSKHGVRYLLKQNGTLPETVAAPTCQTCHMQDGNHEVHTGWGFLGVRLPLPDDERWAADRTTILQAFGILDPSGQPTARLDVVKAADAMRLTQAEWEVDREQIEGICMECHSINYVRAELDKGDQMIREADHLLAEAIRVVAQLYRDGVIKKPADYAYAFPDLLTLNDAPTPIERRLFEMHLEHRMRAFQGTFHTNPDYALRYGWSAMVWDLAEIKEMAAQMRRR